MFALSVANLAAPIKQHVFCVDSNVAFKHALNFFFISNVLFYYILCPALRTVLLSYVTHLTGVSTVGGEF